VIHSQSWCERVASRPASGGVLKGKGLNKEGNIHQEQEPKQDPPLASGRTHKTCKDGVSQMRGSEKVPNKRSPFSCRAWKGKRSALTCYMKRHELKYFTTQCRATAAESRNGKVTPGVFLRKKERPAITRARNLSTAGNLITSKLLSGGGWPPAVLRIPKGKSKQD